MIDDPAGEARIPDWKRVDSDPVSPATQTFLRNELQRRAGWVDDLDTYLRAFVAGRSVLDLGAVGHEESRAKDADWKHRKITEWAGRVVGIDILPDAVAALQRQGFDVRVADATSDADLGERFERIYVGDVIEHVNDPVRLLTFAKRHLAPSGEVLVKTPNPHFAGYLWRNWRYGTFVANAEHISWVGPSMALELGRRSGLLLDRYFRVRPRRAGLFRSAAYRLSGLVVGNSEILNPSFLYLYR